MDTLTTDTTDTHHVDAADASAIEDWAIRLTRRPGWPEHSLEAERHCVVLATDAHLERKGVRVPLGVDHAEALAAYLETADADAHDLIAGRLKVERYRRAQLRTREG